MSDYRAIAAATVTLQNLLTEAIRDAAPGAGVTSGPPPARTEHDQSDGLINVFLYKVEPNAVWRNEELPYRRSDGTLIRKPQLAIDLYYLLSFYGDDSRQIPNLLLGAALTALHAEPHPRAHHVPQASAGGDGAVNGGPSLADTGLLTQRHSLSFTLLSGDQDEVIQTWAQLMHSSYILSVAYIARVVLLEPEVVPEVALPARRTALLFHSDRQPRLDALSPASLPYSAATEVRLSGENLAAEHIQVLVGELASIPVTVADRELRFLPPDGVQAGTHLVRIVHGRRTGGQMRWSVVSNPLALVLRPVVLEAGHEPALAPDGGGASEAGARTFFRVRFMPPVTTTTAAELILNRTPTPREPEARGYVFSGAVEPSRPEVLEILATVEPGRYLVRIRIAGVDSPLTVDRDPASPTRERYIAPVVEILE